MTVYPQILPPEPRPGTLPQTEQSEVAAPARLLLLAGVLVVVMAAAVVLAFFVGRQSAPVAAVRSASVPQRDVASEPDPEPPPAQPTQTPVPTPTPQPAQAAAPPVPIVTPEAELVATSARPYLTLPPKASDQAEVHYVGSGSDRVDVVVEALEVPVVVVLASHSATDWTVRLDPMAEVEYVVLSGQRAQRVTFVGAQVPVYYSSAQEGGSFHVFYTYKDDSEQRFGIEPDAELGWICTDEPDLSIGSTFLHTVGVVDTLTGKSPRGMQGSYYRESFSIGEHSRDASLLDARDRGNCYEGMAGEPA